MPTQSGVRLLPFQRTFEAAAMNPAYDVAAMSGPRGLSKTFLAARVLTRCMTPGDPFHESGAEYILIAASIDQARLCYGFIRPALEPMGGFRFLDSAQRIGITHPDTGTRLRVISSSGKTAFGLVNVRMVVLDEPGAFDILKGQTMADALFTALGKVGSPLKLVMIGTLAPMATTAGHWWYDLVDLGTSGTTHVTSFRGDATKWDQWAEIRRCNPLTAISPEFRAKLLQERDAARRDSRLKARFLSYRLNCPSADESTVLLTVDDWQRTEARAVPDVEGRPVVGLDLGGGRAWSAAVALWPNGRCEAIAVAPGIPSIEAQEKRDRVSRGTYQRLVDSGRLQIADGLRVQPPSALLELVKPWRPHFVVCDRFRYHELLDAAGRLVIVPRVTRWSEAAFDIRALRKSAKDGPLASDPDACGLLKASLSAARVKNDEQGGFRVVKRDGFNNTGRDDVAAALVLAAGAQSRQPTRAPGTGVYLGVA